MDTRLSFKTVFLFIALLGSVLMVLGCGKERGTVFVYCGTSMSKPMQEIARKFEEETGAKVEFTFGGSETLLPQIVLTKKGDIFVCHDPYADYLAEKGLMEDDRVVGYLAPVLIVPKGNPKGIKRLEDLTKPGLRVALGDPRFQTCAQMIHEKLKEKGIKEAVMKNVVLEARSHQELGNAIKLGTADAAVVWNFIAVINSDALDAIWTGDEYPDIKVHICLLSCSKDKKLAREFLDYASSDESRALFEKYGYRK